MFHEQNMFIVFVINIDNILISHISVIYSMYKKSIQE